MHTGGTGLRGARAAGLNTGLNRESCALRRAVRSDWRDLNFLPYLNRDLNA